MPTHFISGRRVTTISFRGFRSVTNTRISEAKSWTKCIAHDQTEGTPNLSAVQIHQTLYIILIAKGVLNQIVLIPWLIGTAWKDLNRVMSPKGGLNRSYFLFEFKHQIFFYKRLIPGIIKNDRLVQWQSVRVLFWRLGFGSLRPLFLPVFSLPPPVVVVTHFLIFSRLPPVVAIIFFLCFSFSVFPLLSSVLLMVTYGRRRKQTDHKNIELYDDILDHHYS